MLYYLNSHWVYLQFRLYCKITSSKTEVTHSSGCRILPQEMICFCPLFATQFESKICQRLSMNLSPLMRDGLRRARCLSAPLSAEVIELNFPHISRLRLLSALLCCRGRLSDYHTMRENVEKKNRLKSMRFSRLHRLSVQCVCCFFVFIC